MQHSNQSSFMDSHRWDAEWCCSCNGLKYLLGEAATAAAQAAWNRHPSCGYLSVPQLPDADMLLLVSHPWNVPLHAHTGRKPPSVKPSHAAAIS
jgi:hypothetical protein